MPPQRERSGAQCRRSVSEAALMSSAKGKSFKEVSKKNRRLKIMDTFFRLGSPAAQGNASAHI